VTRNVLLIDNLDSFTFNLVESFERLGCSVKTVRNTISVPAAIAMAEEMCALIVLSPGPGRPEDSGCCIALIAAAKGRLPLLGICLGHQAILQEAGGKVETLGQPVHGKATMLEHDGTGPFEGLTRALPVGRYHSLGSKDVPKRFRVHASNDGIAMAISDCQARQVGLQFHPESVLTPDGNHILKNVLAMS
jgi:anthranilate synthase/aminodeoxychorismate synthase-like glutamine amidotransferase